MAKTYAHDRCLNGMQILTGNTILLQDGTATPQVSPLAYTTAEINLVIPTNAVELVIRPTTDLRVKTTTSGTPYFVIPAYTTMVFGVAKLASSGGSLYFLRDSASGTLNFYFVTL